MKDTWIKNDNEQIWTTSRSDFVLICVNYSKFIILSSDLSFIHWSCFDSFLLLPSQCHLEKWWTHRRGASCFFCGTPPSTGPMKMFPDPEAGDPAVRSSLARWNNQKRVCLKMVSTPKPNGFADHYPYYMASSLGIYPTFSDIPKPHSGGEATRLSPAPDAKDRKSEKRPLYKVAQSLFTEIHSTSPCCAAPVWSFPLCFWLTWAATTSWVYHPNRPQLFDGVDHHLNMLNSFPPWELAKIRCNNLQFFRTKHLSSSKKKRWSSHSPLELSRPSSPAARRPGLGAIHGVLWGVVVTCKMCWSVYQTEKVVENKSLIYVYIYIEREREIRNFVFQTTNINQSSTVFSH